MLLCSCIPCHTPFAPPVYFLNLARFAHKRFSVRPGRRRMQPEMFLSASDVRHHTTAQCASVTCAREPEGPGDVLTFLSNAISLRCYVLVMSINTKLEDSLNKALETWGNSQCYQIAGLDSLKGFLSLAISHPW